MSGSAIRWWTSTAMILMLCACGAKPEEGLKVRDVWARATPPGTSVAAVYLRIDNPGPADRLLKVRTDISDMAGLHETVEQDGMMQMREIAILEVPAGSEVELRPNGLHLMLMGIKQPLLEGEKLALTLTFERAGDQQVEVSIAGFGAMGPEESPSAGHAGH